MSRSPLTLLNSNGARSEPGSHSTCISGPPDTRHKLNHQIKPPSFLPSSSPPWHSSSPFKAAVLSPVRTCRGLSWLQKEAPGTQAPQERQPSWARGGQKRGSKLSAQHSGEGDEVGAGAALGDISGSRLPPQQPRSLAHFFQLSLKPRIDGISPFLSSHHPQLPASMYPPKTAAFSWEQNGWQQGEGLGAPEGFPLHPSAVSESLGGVLWVPPFHQTPLTVCHNQDLRGKEVGDTTWVWR